MTPRAPRDYWPFTELPQGNSAIGTAAAFILFFRHPGDLSAEALAKAERSPNFRHPGDLSAEALA